MIFKMETISHTQMFKPNFKIVDGKRKKLVIDTVTNAPLTLKTGLMYMPFLPNFYENTWSNFANYKLAVRVSDDFMKTCDYLDESISKNYDNSTIYTTMLKRKGDYPPLLNLTLPRDSQGRFETVVFESDRVTKHLITEQNINELFCKGRKFYAEIECEKLWEFTTKDDNQHRAGLSWILRQVVLEKQEQKGTDYNNPTPIVVNLLS